MGGFRVLHVEGVPSTGMGFYGFFMTYDILLVQVPLKLIQNLINLLVMLVLFVSSAVLESCLRVSVEAEGTTCYSMVGGVSDDAFTRA